MANVAHQSVLSPAEPNALADVCAVFVVGAAGDIVANNASARQLWSAGNRRLATLPLVALFTANGAAAEPDALAEEWKRLKAEASERWVQHTAKPFDGSTCEVRLRIERASGGGGSYIVSVQPLSRG